MEVIISPKQKKWIKSSLSIFIAISILLILALPKINQSGAGDPVEMRTSSGGSRISVEYFVPSAERYSERVYASGSVRADEEIQLRSEVSGIIDEMFFEESTSVEKGQLLVKMNDSELQPQLRRLEYQINLAQIREERQKNLLSSQAIAQEDYDIALNEYNTLIAEKDLIQARIDKTEIRAPFEGKIGLKNISPGTYITPSDVIASLQKTDRVKIDFSIPERFQRSVQVGQKIEFAVQGNDETLEGDIYAIEPRIDRETRTLSIRALASNDHGHILPGNYARVELELSAIDDAILIPTEALIPDISGHRVFIYKNGEVASTEVEAGARTDTHVQILEGLTLQDSVITTGLLQIREGMDVLLIER